MTNSLTPRGMSPRIAGQIYHGEYLGLRGAIRRTLRAHLKNAWNGSVCDCMILMNVFYSAAGNMWANTWIYKPLAPIFLYLAKCFGVQAFIKKTNCSNFKASLEIIDIQLREKFQNDIDFGDVQVMQSCFARWGQMKKRLHLDAAYELEVVKSCSMTLNQPYVPHTLQALSSAILMEYAEPESIEWQVRKKEVEAFYEMYADEIGEGEAEAGVVQTFIRIARALGMHNIARRVAAHYGLSDQLQKSI